MRSLALKLTLAFLLVGVIGALLVAVLVRQFTQLEFGRLVLDQNQQALVANLTRYYQQNGSWNDVESVFRPGADNPGFDIPGQRYPESRWETRRTLFIITNPQGFVVFSNAPRYLGITLSPAELRKGVTLESDGRKIGWLIFTPLIDQWEPGTPEGNFLLSVNRAIYLSAVAAAGIALILGGFLAYSLTRTLRELTTATKELAKGQFGTRVEVRSKDELGELAASFNQMSADLETSIELRRKMTADIAHDLRTPLSVISGYTEAISDGKLEPTPEIYNTLYSETLHLSRLVDDLKTLSLAESGELSLYLQKVNPADLIRRTASAYRVQAEDKQITLKVNYAPDLPEIVVDTERMAQVMGNLMSNALRYTPPEGQILISGHVQDGEVVLSVSDSGPGIPAEDLPYIFERSFRGDKARSQQNGETGLGLAIARSLVLAQGGKIKVESTPGKGTTLTILLPLG